jgi:hypothetical protein
MAQTNLSRLSAWSVFYDDKFVIVRAGFFILLSVLLLFSYFFLSSVFSALGSLMIVGSLWLLLMLGIAGIFGIEFSFALLLTSMFLQNGLISGVTTYDPNNQTAFLIMQGTSFFIVSLFSMYGCLMWLKRRHTLAPENTALLRWILIFSLFIILYSGLGLISSDMKSVVAYARVYLGAVMFFIIGIESGYKISANFFVGVIRILAVVLVVWGIIEISFPEKMIEAFSVIDYTRMKFLGSQHAITHVKELLEGVTYLNFSGQFGLDFKMHRLTGPNIHAISYAYELGFCCLVCFMYRYRFLAAACFMMLLFVGSKGAIVLTSVSLLFYALYFVIKRPRWMLFFLAAFVAFYILFVTYYGLATEDFHILGLIGSLNGFLENPLGYGVGVGGNLSTQGLYQSSIEDFQRYQHQGATDLALESGFGVMLYQFGVSAVVFLGFYGRVLKSIWSKIVAQDIDRRMIILPVALALVLVNSLFQEEAFSPVCLGLWLMYSGFFLSRRWQEKTAQELRALKR